MQDPSRRPWESNFKSIDINWNLQKNLLLYYISVINVQVRLYLMRYWYWYWYYMLECLCKHVAYYPMTKSTLANSPNLLNQEVYLGSSIKTILSFSLVTEPTPEFCSEFSNATFEFPANFRLLTFVLNRWRITRQKSKSKFFNNLKSEFNGRNNGKP